MIKINYFDERELLVRREIETKTPKCYSIILGLEQKKGFTNQEEMIMILVKEVD